MRDEFVKAWGPRKSPKLVARRARALAREAALQRCVQARESRLFWQALEDDDVHINPDVGGWGGVDGGWGNGGGLVTGVGSAGLVWDHDAPPLKPSRRFPHAWSHVRLLRQLPTLLKTLECFTSAPHELRITSYLTCMAQGHNALYCGYPF
jgi:hypothetical protein